MPPKKSGRRVTINTDTAEQAPNGTHEPANADENKIADNVDNADNAAGTDAASPTPAATPTLAAPTPAAPTTAPQRKNLEEGPLTFKQAVVVVSTKYNNMFKSIQVHTEPVIRDGSVITFKSNGVTLGQGVLRVGTSIIFDDAQNTFLSLLVTNISYGQEPINFQMQ